MPSRVPLALTIAIAATMIGGVGATAASSRVVNGCSVQKGAKCAGLDLSGQNLRGAGLRDADLRGANLARADLRNADLRGARLGRADLRGAQMSGARLQNATMVRVKAGPAPGVRVPKLPNAISSAWCGSTNVSGTNLQNANLNGANLTNGFFQFANMSGAQLRGAQASGADFQCASWANVNAASSVNLSKSTWYQCYTGTTTKTILTSAKLAGADLTGARLVGFPDTTYADCNKLGAWGSYGSTTFAAYYPDLTNVMFQYTQFVNTNLQYTKLPSSGSGLMNVSYWSNTTCPNGKVQSSMCPSSP